MDRVKREDEVRKAEDMTRLKDKFLNQFFIDREKELFTAFKNVSAGDTDALVTIHHGLKALQSLENKVQSALDSGKMARSQLDDAEK